MPSILGTDIFDDFFGGYAPSKKPTRAYRMTTSETMKTDIKETDTGYELYIDLPGFKKEDVKAELKDGYMTITAETRTEKNIGDDENLDTPDAETAGNAETEASDKAPQAKYIYRERFVGTCSRSFYVGKQIDEEDIQAKFEDGILKMFVPKKEVKVPEKKYISIAG